MARKPKKYVPKTFESSKGVGDVSANIYVSMLQNKTWQSLTPRQQRLYIYMKQKRSIYLQVENIDRFLFCDEYGEPLNSLRVQSEINRIVKKIRESGKEFPHVVQHTFRHTFATRAIEAGMKPQVLKTILGHSSLAMTMDLYSHVLPDTKAQEMEKIANIF